MHRSTKWTLELVEEWPLDDAPPMPYPLKHGRHFQPRTLRRVSVYRNGKPGETWRVDVFGELLTPSRLAPTGHEVIVTPDQLGSPPWITALLRSQPIPENPRSLMAS